MNKDLSNYIHKHTLLISLVVIAAFLALAWGELFLYRKVMTLNQMVSEGTMQIKEAVNATKPAPAR